MVPLLLAVLLAVGLASSAGQPAEPAADGPSYFFMLGRHLEGEGKQEEAIAAHKQAIALAPGSADSR